VSISVQVEAVSDTQPELLAWPQRPIDVNFDAIRAFKFDHSSCCESAWTAAVAIWRTTRSPRPIDPALMICVWDEMFVSA
jgi:hypothetical protein